MLNVQIRIIIECNFYFIFIFVCGLSLDPKNVLSTENNVDYCSKVTESFIHFFILIPHR